MKMKRLSRLLRLSLKSLPTLRRRLYHRNYIEMVRSFTEQRFG